MCDDAIEFTRVDRHSFGVFCPFESRFVRQLPFDLFGGSTSGLMRQGHAVFDQDHARLILGMHG
jgi:hypothetical protein